MIPHIFLRLCKCKQGQRAITTRVQLAVKLSIPWVLMPIVTCSGDPSCSDRGSLPLPYNHQKAVIALNI